MELLRMLGSSAVKMRRVNRNRPTVPLDVNLATAADFWIAGRIQPCHAPAETVAASPEDLSAGAERRLLLLAHEQ